MDKETIAQLKTSIKILFRQNSVLKETVENLETTTAFDKELIREMLQRISKLEKELRELHQEQARIRRFANVPPSGYMGPL